MTAHKVAGLILLIQSNTLRARCELKMYGKIKSQLEKKKKKMTAQSKMKSK